VTTKAPDPDWVTAPVVSYSIVLKAQVLPGLSGQICLTLGEESTGLSFLHDVSMNTTKQNSKAFTNDFILFPFYDCRLG
jgi:hypothetical protein